MCLFLFAAITFSQAQTTVEISDSARERIFMPYDLPYFIDATNQLPFKLVSSDDFLNRFQKHSSYQNIDFETNASYWIRIPIKPNPNSTKVWLLEFYDQTIDTLEAYIPQRDGSFKKIEMGDHHLFQHRNFSHKNFEVVVDKRGDGVQPYYFKVRSHEFADVRVALRSVDRFIYYALNEYYLYGMFYGMILIITVYNFLVFIAIREIKFIGLGR